VIRELIEATHVYK